MNPNRSRFLPSPGKFVAALPAVIAACQASAEIIYTDFGPSGLFSTNGLEFSLDGSTSFTENGSYHFSLNVKSADIHADYLGIGWSAVAEAPPLGENQMIGPDLTFRGYISFPEGTGPTYVGLRQYDTVSDQTIYGWAKVKWGAGDSWREVTLYGVAYETTGAGILTGDTGMANVPEPGASAAFAGLVAGSVAAFVARRRRKEQSSAAV